MELLGGEVDFKVTDGFEVVLVDEFTLVLVDVKGLGRGRDAERTYRFKQTFPVMSNLIIFLAACETL